MFRLACVLAIVAATPALARAEQRDQARRAADAALHRARRSVAIGPTVGVGGAYAVSANELEAPLSLGLELVLFGIPVVPDADTVKDAVLERDRGVVEEYLGNRPRRDRTWEKPRLVIALEGTYLARAGAGQARLGAGIGISKLTIGPTVAVDWAGDNGLLVGGELAVHLTPSAGPRTRVYDLLVRYDRGVTAGTDGADAVTLGVKILADLI